jgi:hypothetical protein
MPSNRSATDTIVDRLSDLLNKVLGPFAAPAKPAPVPVPVQPRRTPPGRRAAYR